MLFFISKYLSHLFLPGAQFLNDAFYDKYLTACVMFFRSAPVDLQLPTSLDAIEETIITNPSEKPKMKFREKKVDTLGSEFVAFKKRKMAASAARSMKQREDNT